MSLIFALGAFSFALSLIVTPFVRDLFRHLGLVDYPDNSRKLHAYPVPRIGGIVIVIGCLGAFALTLLPAFSDDAAMILKAMPGAWKIAVAALIVFLTGLIDDLKGLTVWQKLAGQTIAATVAYWAGIQVQILGLAPGMPWVTFVITIAWLLLSANAFNLIDGMDGFAAGAGLFATLTILLAALTQHNLPLALVTVPLAGCLLGFLRYNFNPASVFLGDCGSLLIGFLLGCYGALWSNKSATLLGMTAPLIAMAIPLLDTALSIVRRFLRHQPIFGADRGHIHHKLLDLGLSPRQAALLMYGVCGIAAAFSLTLNALQNQFGGLIVVVFCVAAWIGVQHLGYEEFASAHYMFFKGDMRRIIDSQTRLRQFEDALAKTAGPRECWDVILGVSRSLGFNSVRMNLQGVITEQSFKRADRDVSWQLRIPLSAGEYVNFQGDLRPGIGPSVLTAFVGIVQSGLRAKIHQFESNQMAQTSAGAPNDLPVRRAMVSTGRPAPESAIATRAG